MIHRLVLRKRPIDETLGWPDDLDSQVRADFSQKLPWYFKDGGLIIHGRCRWILCLDIL